MTKRKRNPLLAVAGGAGRTTLRGLAPVVATAAAAGALAGVVAVPLDRWLKSKDSMY